MLNKALALVLAAGLLAAWTAAEVALAPWSAPALADDDDDDRRRPLLRLRPPPVLPHLPRPVPRHQRPEILAAGLSTADLDRLLTQGNASALTGLPSPAARHAPISAICLSALARWP